MADPMLRHLLDLVERVEPSAFLLGGGLGLRVKRGHVLHHGTVTLAQSAGYELPEARATADIDLFLHLDVFVDAARAVRLRTALDDLGYQALVENLKFAKQLTPDTPDQQIVVDLHARPPAGMSSVKVHGIRVGARSSVGLHGRKTEEAFAVDASPVAADILMDDQIAGMVAVPHPYAWLNLKLRAAHDWLRYCEQPWPLGPEQKPPSPKHAFDAALVVAMASEAEVDEAAELSGRWRGLEPATAIIAEAYGLFGSPDAAGWREARRQGMFDDHALIWDTMRTMLGTA